MQHFTGQEQQSSKHTSRRALCTRASPLPTRRQRALLRSTLHLLQNTFIPCYLKGGPKIEKKRKRLLLIVASVVQNRQAVSRAWGVRAQLCASTRLSCSHIILSDHATTGDGDGYRTYSGGCTDSVPRTRCTTFVPIGSAASKSPIFATGLRM